MIETGVIVAVDPPIKLYAPFTVVLPPIASAPVVASFTCNKASVKLALPFVIDVAQYLFVFKDASKPVAVPPVAALKTSDCTTTVPPAFVVGLTNANALIVVFPIGNK